jgi:hypothetical protein
LTMLLRTQRAVFGCLIVGLDQTPLMQKQPASLAREIKVKSVSQEPSVRIQLTTDLYRIPSDLHGKCLNLLSSLHRVATNRMCQPFLRCKGFRDLARDCKQP